jgi:hypothetical protein
VLGIRATTVAPCDSLGLGSAQRIELAMELGHVCPIGWAIAREVEQSGQGHSMCATMMLHSNGAAMLTRCCSALGRGTPIRAAYFYQKAFLPALRELVEVDDQGNVLRDRLGGKRPSPYTLRHNEISWLLGGVPMFVVPRDAGNDSYDTPDRRYGHLDRTASAAAAQVLAAQIPRLKNLPDPASWVWWPSWLIGFSVNRAVSDGVSKLVVGEHDPPAGDVDRVNTSALT